MPGKRNVIRYNSVGLFLTEDFAEGKLLKFFNRAQSANLSVDINRQDVKHIGSENFLVRKIVSEASISLKIDYLLTDGYEEDTLGLNIGIPESQNPSGSLHKKIKDNKSIFLVVGEEQFDLVGYTEKENKFEGNDVIGIGNCFITDYQISASVGSLAKASVSMVASDLNYACLSDGKEGYMFSRILNEISALLRQDSPFSHEIPGEADAEDEGDDFITYQDESKVFLQDSGEQLIPDAQDPSLDLENGGIIQDIDGFVFDPKMYNSVVSAIPPGGIRVTVKNINVGGPLIHGEDDGSCILGSAHIQSFDASIPFAREDLYGFESMHVYGRKMNFPQLGAFSMSILSSAFKNGRFSEIFCKDDFYQIEVEFDNQCNFSCHEIAKDSHMKLVITNAKLDGYSMSYSVGGIGTVDCNFSFGVSTTQGAYLFGSKPDTRANSFKLNKDGKYEGGYYGLIKGEDNVFFSQEDGVGSINQEGDPITPEYIINKDGADKCTPKDSDKPTDLQIDEFLTEKHRPKDLEVDRFLEDQDSPSNLSIVEE